jgi:2-dehydro-3-deoxyphosphogluconate aldolase/(4S)-4-hydroxy-2-oxoglutarate aldolase
MAKHSKLEVLTAMKQTGLVPVFYHPDFETAKNVVSACADGGAECVEFTNRGDRAINIFTRLAEFRDAERQDIILGIGSVCDAPTAAMYISAGADFIVAPTLDEETARLCNARKISYSPGCGTVGEIQKAHIFGVDIVKIFPANTVGGPEFVRAIKAPCPWTDIMPTGGVTPAKENLKEWFDAGIVCAGMGSKLITKELVAAKDWTGITKKVRDTIELIKQIRKGV